MNTRNAAVITPFYTPEATVALTEKSISSMVFYGRVLFTPNKALRRAIDTGLYITFHHDAIADMMMTTQDVPELQAVHGAPYRTVRQSTGTCENAFPGCAKAAPKRKSLLPGA